MEANSTRALTIAGRRALELSIKRFVVTVEEGLERGREATLSGASLCVGSHPESDLVLADPTVSARHVVLTLTPQGVLATDQQSKNGTWIEGTRIQSAFVADGARLRLGETVCRVRLVPGRVVVFPDGQESFAGMLGRSQAMQDLFALVRQLARTDLPVLIVGETGSGKELVARALHAAGPRSDKPLLVVDCAAIVPGLLRSELFGFEKGAFTGADRTTRGVLEEARGGTIFLDEIGEMELAVQPQLLRALESREVSRIGSRQTMPVSFRTVSATNRDLGRMCGDGRFREDLFFRLSCVTVTPPPLRDRREDIPLLAGHFIAQFANRNGVSMPELSKDALSRLMEHAWPGNVRELRNAVETLSALAGEGPITGSAVERVLSTRGRPSLESVPDSDPARHPEPARATVVSLEESEKQALVQALAATGWRRKAAARNLGISPTTLFAKIRRYGLKPPDSMA